MRLVMKMMIIPVFLILKITGAISRIIVEVSALVAGPFLFFILGCGVYCIVTTNWKSLLILGLIAGAVYLLYIVAGLVLGLLEIADRRMGRFLKS